jgi:vancomycin permeability regulator SanA
MTIKEIGMNSRKSLGTIARAIALFFSTFTLLNLLGELRGRFDLNLWWIDLRRLPFPENPLLLWGALAMLAWAIFPRQSKWRRRLDATVVTILLAAATGNALDYYRQLARGEILTDFPIPLSLFIALALLWILLAILFIPQPATLKSKRQALLAAATFLFCAILFPLAQMVCFGWTDYRRHADVIVVLGAKVSATGVPSQVLYDRVKTACDLYNQGYAPRIIMSGGPGAGPIDEPAAMQTLAMQFGVPANAILLDHQGLNTAATVENTSALFRKGDRILAVSHFYHLPRIKMSYQRAGCDVCTVPAKQTWIPRQLPYYLLREIAALWVYYIRGQ